MQNTQTFASESVCIGHPDKIADQISDAVLDEILRQDPNGRVACETLVTTGMVLVSGEITTTAYVDIPKIAREVLRNAGYTRSEYGISAEDCAVLSTIDEQSPDIAMGVDQDGAGDQGIMFGYACNDTPQLMPLPITLAHQLTKKLQDVREDTTVPHLRPDGKGQVSVDFDTNGKPIRLSNIVLSAQHDPEIRTEDLRAHLLEKVIKPVCGEWIDDQTELFINPTGRFVVGGPKGDVGMTGRKIIVDTYGGMARHGGGAFSGKDATKVDRSAAYAARYIAKNIVAHGMADRCEVQIGYAIGHPEPVSLYIETFGTETKDIQEIIAYAKTFPLHPQEIIQYFGLKKPIFGPTAVYGHFGKEGFPWEKIRDEAKGGNELKT